MKAKYIITPSRFHEIFAPARKVWGDLYRIDNTYLQRYSHHFQFTELFNFIRLIDRYIQNELDQKSTK